MPRNASRTSRSIRCGAKRAVSRSSRRINRSSPRSKASTTSDASTTAGTAIDPLRDSTFPLFATLAHQLSARDAGGGFPTSNAFPQLFFSRFPRRFPKLAKKVVRQRQARLCRARFENAVELLRHIADLDHLAHAGNMKACAAHVKLLLLESAPRMATRKNIVHVVGTGTIGEPLV